MKVFMLGWEFPPHISGGLGTACYGITKAITAQGVDVVFVLPRPIKYLYVDEQIETTVAAPAGSGDTASARPVAATPNEGSLEFRSADLPNVTFHMVDAMLAPYTDARGYAQQFVEHKEVMISGRSAPPSSASPLDPPASAPSKPITTVSTIKRRVMTGGAGHYAGDLMTETQRYANLAMSIAKKDRFDVVHAHDWMTFPAGMAVAAAQRKPLIVHIHSTEIDRAGDHGNPKIFQMEKEGMQAATGVIAVSELTRQLIIERYGIHPDKIHVVHNGIEIKRTGKTPVSAVPAALPPPIRIEEQEKIVLFLGRMTAQKGPDYFVAAARKVLEVYDNVKFIMAGSGDMIHETIEQAAEMGIGHKVFFTGFLQGSDVERIFKMADLYVMPSVSEPFGIAPLEAMSHDVPVIISRQSGVAEVLDHVLKVDFWDTDDMANKILAVLRHAPLSATLRHRGSIEISQITWTDAARKIREIYTGILAKKRASKRVADTADRLSVSVAAVPTPRPVAPPAPQARTLPPKNPPKAAAAAKVESPVEKLAVPVKRPAAARPVRSMKQGPQGKGSGPENSPAKKLRRRVAASQRDARPVEALHVKVSRRAKPIRSVPRKKPVVAKTRPLATKSKKAVTTKPKKSVVKGVEKAAPKKPAPSRTPAAAKKPRARVVKTPPTKPGKSAAKATKATGKRNKAAATKKKPAGASSSKKSRRVVNEQSASAKRLKTKSRKR